MVPLDILKIKARFYTSDPVNAKRGVEIEWIKHHDCVAFLALSQLLSRDISSRLDRGDSLLTKARTPQEMDRVLCYLPLSIYTPRCYG